MSSSHAMRWCSPITEYRQRFSLLCLKHGRSWGASKRPRFARFAVRRASSQAKCSPRLRVPLLCPLVTVLQQTDNKCAYSSSFPRRRWCPFLAAAVGLCTDQTPELAQRRKRGKRAESIEETIYFCFLNFDSPFARPQVRGCVRCVSGALAQPSMSVQVAPARQYRGKPSENREKLEIRERLRVQCMRGCNRSGSGLRRNAGVAFCFVVLSQHLH